MRVLCINISDDKIQFTLNIGNQFIHCLQINMYYYIYR